MIVAPPFVRRIRARARWYANRLRRDWAGHPAQGSEDAILDGEVDRLLSDSDISDEPADATLAAAISDADAAAAADARLMNVRNAFALGDAETDLLTLAGSIEVDPHLARVFAYLQDDHTRAFPTPWLAQQLFEWPSCTVNAASALVQWQLAHPAPSQAEPWSVHAAWVVNPHIASCLVDELAVDPVVAPASRLVKPGDERPPCLYPEALAQAVRFVQTLSDDAAMTIEVALVGAAGAGKRTLATQVCAQLGVPLLIVDVGAVVTSSGPSSGALLLAAARSAALLGAAVYWHDCGALVPAAWSAITDKVHLSILGATEATALHTIDPQAVRRVIYLPALGRAARLALWDTLDGGDPPTPITEWPLLPADVTHIAAVAAAGPEAMRDACTPPLPAEAATLMSRLPPTYEWEDLVTRPSTRSHLQELLDQARLRAEVYEELGFGRLCPASHGISALLAGPSGTGKTMAAQIIGQRLGMDVYRVDLSAVVSKYVGETAKQLRTVFDACTRANVVLFFDEADALFGRRTRVKDAHDRFANVEVAYLLQRMESYDGISILATNRRGDLDPAFVRRLRFIIEFLPPNPAERLELWRRTLVPAGEGLLGDVDFDELAERLDLTGAEIKGAGLAAAFLACADQTTIQMHHIVRAAKRELAKRNKVVRWELTP